jgi:predicted nucleotidyltransferase
LFQQDKYHFGFSREREKMKIKENYIQIEVIINMREKKRKMEDNIARVSDKRITSTKLKRILQLITTCPD